MRIATAPDGYTWVSCSQDVSPGEFARTRHLAKTASLREHWVTTVCQATGAGVGTFRRDNRKPDCERCLLFAQGWRAGRKS